LPRLGRAYRIFPAPEQAARPSGRSEGDDDGAGCRFPTSKPHVLEYDRANTIEHPEIPFDKNLPEMTNHPAFILGTLRFR
jgi:hypothetical protein